MERKADFKPCVLWVGGDAFVQIVDVKLKGTISDLTLEIKAINRVNSTLIKIDYEVVFYDSGEMKIQSDPYQVSGEGIDIEPDKIGIASRLNISKSFSNTRRAEVKLLKAYFSDGKSIDLIYDNMERFAINSISEDDLSILKKVAGEDVRNLPAKLISNWRCICGYFNGDESEYCNNCYRDKSQIFTDYKSIEYIKEVIEKEIQGEYEISKNNIDEEDEEPIDQEELMRQLLQEQEQYSQENSDKEQKVKEKIYIKEEIIEFLKDFPKVNLMMFLLSGVFVSSSIFLFLMRKL